MEEDLVTRAGYQITTLPAAGLHGVGARALPGNLLQIWSGFWAARKLLAEFKPQALFFTGGFVAAPVALAGSNIPTLAFVPDVKPGFALRFVARFADRIALVTEKSASYFSRPQRLHTTGYPVRKDLAKWKKEVARAHFGLQPDLPVLLVFGGSKGARSINQALTSVLPRLLKNTQIIHISGSLNWPESQAAASQLPKELAARYLAFHYLHDDMGAALAAADLVLSRAGASTLGEFPLFGLPAVLVPIPFKQHLQHVNAAYLEKTGAAIILEDKSMSDHLASTILGLLSDSDQLSKMSAAMQKLHQPNAAQQIAQLLRGLAGDSKEGRRT